MVDKSRASVPDSQHTPEFKLQVVLEYLRNPRRKRHILKEKGITEELLAEWHREFLSKATQIFGDTRTPPAPSPTKESSTTTGFNLQPGTVSPPPVWGIKINKSSSESYTSPSSSREPPSWFGRSERAQWQERGVVVWDEGSRQTKVLTAGEVLNLLDRLRARGYWRTSGIGITKMHFVRKDVEAPRKDRSRKRKNAEPTSTEDKAQWEAVDEVIFRFDPRVGEEVFAFLQEYEALLKQLTELEKKEFTRELIEILRLGSGTSLEQEEEIDLSKRPVKWTHQPLQHTFVCNPQSNRGTVSLDESQSFWQVCIERPNQFKQSGLPFVKLEEALTWAERALLSPPETKTQPDNQEEQEHSQEQEKPSRSRIDLTPYRVDPAQLEPKQLTFCIIIDLDHAPESFKTVEMSFGKLYRYDEKFPSLAEVLEELHTDPAQVTIEQPLGSDDDWYRIHSVAVFRESEKATAQAQQLWTQSELRTLYRDGKVRRARYGIEEVETRYVQWLGELDDPEHPWVPAPSREEHMAEKAMRETLAYALDVDGFREHLGFTKEDASDESLLATLHRVRAHSICIPKAERMKSARWLKRHGNTNSGAC